MIFNTKSQMEFFSEMSERQLTAREFFGSVLLDSLKRNFQLDNSLIMFFDPSGRFLSWTGPDASLTDSSTHPYRKLRSQDVIGDRIYRDAVRDRLDYFNTEPRLYRSTDLIAPDGYETSPYAKFIGENFGARYSVTMAFGINAYIRIVFFKTADEGDFTPEDMDRLSDIYISIANAYKGFKKREQAMIVSDIQDEIIASGEKAYFVTDDFMHVLSCNSAAENYLCDILGEAVLQTLNGTFPCLWVPFLLADSDPGSATARSEKSLTAGHRPASGVRNHEMPVMMKTIKNHVFVIHPYDQCYSHGIVDRYHWITITPESEFDCDRYDVHGLCGDITESAPGKYPPAPKNKKATDTDASLAAATGSTEQADINSSDHGSLPELTNAEQKVAGLLLDGLTYRAIADELFISYHTVKKHVENIYAKCHVSSRFELMKLYRER